MFFGSDPHSNTSNLRFKRDVYILGWWKLVSEIVFELSTSTSQKKHLKQFPFPSNVRLFFAPNIEVCIYAISLHLTYLDVPPSKPECTTLVITTLLRLFTAYTTKSTVHTNLFPRYHTKESD